MSAAGRDDGDMTATTSFTSYEQARELHSWDVPSATTSRPTCATSHPRDKLAMIHEDFGGTVREVDWGELQDISNRFANVLRVARGRARATGSRCCCRRRRRRRRRSSGPGRPARSCCRCRCCTATRGSATGVTRLAGEGARHQRGERRTGSSATLVEHVLILDDELLERRLDPRSTPRRHGGRRPGAALLLLGHDRPRQGHPPRPPLHPRPRGVRLLPRRPRRRACSTAWASGRGRPASAR